MPRYNVYIPFIATYEGEPYEEEFSTIVKAENEKDAIQEAINELNSEYVVKTIDSREITVEEIPTFPSFDEWEENFTAIKNPHAQEGEQGLAEIMFDTDGDQYQTVRGFDSSKIWTIRSTEYVVKTIDSREITVEELPEFPSFDEWEENFTALKNPHAQEGEQGLGEIMFDTDGDQYQTVRGFDSSKIWTIRSTEYGLMLTAGYGLVDRFGYILSEESFTEEDKNKAYIID